MLPRRRCAAATPTRGSCASTRPPPPRAGVRLVLTARIWGANSRAPLIPHPTLTHAPPSGRSRPTSRYVGEIVAFVVATDRYLAEDAAGLIESSTSPWPS